MSTLTTLSGYVPTRPADELDDDRYDYITLDQAEPNPGNPDADGSIFVSDADGTRSFTKELELDGLSFGANTLTDLSFQTSQYYLVLSGDPTDGTVDEVGWSTLVEIDTLDTVTGRDPVTANNITIGNLLADSAEFTLNVKVTQDLNVDQDILTKGSIFVDQNATILLDANIGKNLTVDSDLTVRGISNLQDSAVLGNRLFLGIADEKDDEIKVLYRRQSDGLILQGDIETDEAKQIYIAGTDSNAVHYPLFSLANRGEDGYDSVYVDFDEFTYQPATNTLSLINLSAINADVTGIANLDSTFIAGDVRIQTQQGRLLDSAGRSFVVYDSSGALLWGNNGDIAGDGETGQVFPVNLSLNDLLDVDTSTVSDGQIIKYNAATSKWIAVPDAAGSGISLTDLDALTETPAGTGDLSYNNITGLFTYTPPVIPTSLLDLSDIAGDGTSNQVLATDGNGSFSFVDPAEGGGGTTNVRVTQVIPTNSFDNNTSTNIEFNAIGKSFILNKVTVDSACWIRLYSDHASRTSDASRVQGQDPIEGSGVLAEFIATSATTFKVTPGVAGWADGVNEIPATITNLTGYANAFNITVNALKLENNDPIIPTYTLSGPASIDEDGP